MELCDCDGQGLQGKTALITGGAGDIGGAITRALARRGANVIIQYHRSGDRAETLGSEIRAAGGSATILSSDLTSETEVRRLAKAAKSLGHIDILINNAGDPVRRVPWQELDGAFLDQAFALNFRAPLFLIQELAPDMIHQGSGVIINTLSTAAHNCGTDTVFAYGSAKGALLTLTRGLARSLAPRGVRVLAVAPGTITGRMQNRLSNAEISESLLRRIPLGRVGQPYEVGEVVAFLCTDYAGFIVGEIIDISGGALL